MEFSPLFHFPLFNKINQLAERGIFTLPPGYGAGGLGAGAQLIVRMQGKAFNSLGSGDAFKEKRKKKKKTKISPTGWGEGK